MESSPFLYASTAILAVYAGLPCENRPDEEGNNFFSGLRIMS